MIGAPADVSISFGWWLLLAAGLAAGIAIGGSARRLLTPSGAIAAFIVGTVIFSIGGLGPSCTLIWFFLSSSLLGKLPGKLAEDKKGRDWKQVACNGFAPVLGCLLVAAFPHSLIGGAFYFGSLATATADTWATELGRRYGGAPYDLFRLRKTRAGLSGGITMIGTLASALGSCSIAILACIPFYWTNFAKGTLNFLLILIAGILGGLLDSMFGSLFQQKFQIDQTGEITENPSEKGNKTIRIQGFTGWTNNTVNLVSTILGGVIAALLT